MINPTPVYNAVGNAVYYGWTREIHATPQFLVNGFTVSLNEKTTYAEWVEFIEDLLDSTSKK